MSPEFGKLTPTTDGAPLVQGKYTEAEQLYKRLLAIDTKLNGPDHPNIVTNLSNFALLLESMVSSAFLAISFTCVGLVWEPFLAIVRVSAEN